MTTTTTTHEALDQELNQTILQGKIMEAFERYYADGVVMQEPGGKITEGKEANRRREEEFVGSIQEVHSVELGAHAVNGDVSLSEWVMDLTFQDGNRNRLEQVAVRHWNDGLVVRERFYYEG